MTGSRDMAASCGLGREPQGRHVERLAGRSTSSRDARPPLDTTENTRLGIKRPRESWLQPRLSLRGPSLQPQADSRCCGDRFQPRAGHEASERPLVCRSVTTTHRRNSAGQARPRRRPTANLLAARSTQVEGLAPHQHHGRARSSARSMICSHGVLMSLMSGRMSCHTIEVHVVHDRAEHGLGVVVLEAVGIDRHDASHFARTELGDVVQLVFQSYLSARPQ